MRAGPRQSNPDRVEGQRVGRAQRECALRGFERLARPMQRDETTATLRVVFGARPAELQRPIDDLERFAEIAVLRGDHREQKQRIRMPRLRRQYPHAELVRAPEFASVDRALGLRMPGAHFRTCGRVRHRGES